MVVAEAEFARRAAHALARDTDDRLGFDESAVGHGGAWCRPWNDVPWLHVESPTPHVVLGSVADVEEHPMHLGGIGVAFGLHHTRRDHTRHRGPDTFDALTRQSDVGQGVGDGFDGCIGR